MDFVSSLLFKERPKFTCCRFNQVLSMETIIRNLLISLHPPKVLYLQSCLYYKQNMCFIGRENANRNCLLYFINLLYRGCWQPHRDKASGLGWQAYLPWLFCEVVYQELDSARVLHLCFVLMPRCLRSRSIFDTYLSLSGGCHGSQGDIDISEVLWGEVARNWI